MLRSSVSHCMERSFFDSDSDSDPGTGAGSGSGKDFGPQFIFVARMEAKMRLATGLAEGRKEGL